MMDFGGFWLWKSMIRIASERCRLTMLASHFVLRLDCRKLVSDTYDPQFLYLDTQYAA